MLDKFASSKIAGVLQDAANTIRSIAAERDEANAKLATIERERRAEKLAAAMIDKGVSSDAPADLVGGLVKKAEVNMGDFEDLERSVALIGPDMGRKLGQVGSTSDHVSNAQGGTSPLESYLLGNS